MKILGAWCPECGPVKTVDEDGLCRSCGCSCTGWGANLAIRNAAALADRDSRIAAATRLLERTGEPGYVLEVDDVMAALSPAKPRAKVRKGAR